VTDVLSRPAGGRAAAREDPAPRPLVVDATLSALAALAVTLVPIELVVLIAWAGDGRSTAPVTEVLRVGVLVLLEAHHVGITVPHGVVALPPLGLTLLPAFLVARAAAAGVRDRQLRRPVEALPLVAATGAAYAAALAVLAVLSRTPGARAPVSQAVLCGLLLGGTAAAIGAARGLGGDALRELSDLLPDVAPAAGAAVACLLGAGALLAGGVLLAHHRDVTGLANLLTPGAAGGFAVVVIDVLLVPNAAVLAVGVLAGPGLAVGRGTSVTVHAVHLGAEPALPLLAAIPANGAMPAAAVALLALPVLAGVLCGVLAVRRAGPATVRAALTRATGAAALAAAGLTVLTALAGGPAGPGRLTAVGASPWRVGAMLLVELAVPAALAAVALTWWESRRRLG
jgi:hypothetical protein